MKLDLLAFGAHPDDVELFAGGTMAKMASLGYSTGIVDMSRGELGTRGTPAIRKLEARRAADILNVKVRENLRMPDGNVTVNPQSRLNVIKIIRKYRPQIVLTHYWDDNHPDHAHTSRLITEAVHHSGLAKIETGQERYRPETILFYKLPPGMPPSFVVDISEFANQRIEAIRAYKSQLFDPLSRAPMTKLSQPDFLAKVEAIHAYYGTLIGKHLGEGFFFKGILEVRDPVKQFA